MDYKITDCVERNSKGDVSAVSGNKNILLVNCSPVRNGATTEIVKMIASHLSTAGDFKSVCIDDYDIKFCKGCRVCHKTAKCVQSGDDTEKLVGEFDRADVIVCVSPSYWADIPGQFKAFIDRCTPWCNTHEPHAVIGSGKKGYAVADKADEIRKFCGKIISN